jgi:hypothetical protein
MEALQISTELDLARDPFCVEHVYAAPGIGTQDFGVRLLIRGTPHTFTYTPSMKRLATAGNLIVILLPSHDNAVLQAAVFDWLVDQEIHRRSAGQPWSAASKQPASASGSSSAETGLAPAP